MPADATAVQVRSLMRRTVQTMSPCVILDVLVGVVRRSCRGSYLPPHRSVLHCDWSRRG
jgi:hypothetical protein